MTSMSKIVFKADKSRLLNRLVFGIAGGAFLIWLYATGVDKAFVIPSLILFAILAARGFWRLFQQYRNSELIILDENGITDSSYGLGFIPWGNIQAARIHEVNRFIQTFRVIELSLKDNKRFFDNKSYDRRLIEKGILNGSTGIWLNTWKLQSSDEDVLETIREYIYKYSS